MVGIVQLQKFPMGTIGRCKGIWSRIGTVHLGITQLVTQITLGEFYRIHTLEFKAKKFFFNLARSSINDEFRNVNRSIVVLPYFSNEVC